MIFVVGENEEVTCAIGCGETIEKAINSWSSNTESFAIAAEVTYYKPRVFQGQELAMGVTLQYSAIPFPGSLA